MKAQRGGRAVNPNNPNNPNKGKIKREAKAKGCILKSSRVQYSYATLLVGA